MTISHHLDDATLMAFSSGTLGDALAAVVGGHLDFCPRCRATLDAMDTIGGALLESVAPEALAPDALATALSAAATAAKVTPLSRARSMAASPGITCDVLPPSVARRLNGPITSISWKWLAPGVKYAPIPFANEAGGDLRLLLIEPTRKMPEHGHGGTELTLVLSGAYHDHTGRYARGDIADLDAEIEHEPVVDPGLPCICIVGAEDRARFKSLAARLMQPFVGM